MSIAVRRTSAVCCCTCSENNHACHAGARPRQTRACQRIHRRDARQSFGFRAGAGHCRFDVLQSPEEPTLFVLYEAYASEADALAHKQTAHYLRWRDAVAYWMAEPRQGVHYLGLYPEQA
jgi:autoinducer 2-degrading protein